MHIKAIRAPCATKCVVLSFKTCTHTCNCMACSHADAKEAQNVVLCLEAPCDPHAALQTTVSHMASIIRQLDPTIHTHNPCYSLQQPLKPHNSTRWSTSVPSSMPQSCDVLQEQPSAPCKPCGMTAGMQSGVCRRACLPMTSSSTSTLPSRCGPSTVLHPPLSSPTRMLLQAQSINQVLDHEDGQVPQMMAHADTATSKQALCQEMSLQESSPAEKAELSPIAAAAAWRKAGTPIQYIRVSQEPPRQPQADCLKAPSAPAMVTVSTPPPTHVTANKSSPTCLYLRACRRHSSDLLQPSGMQWLHVQSPRTCTSEAETELKCKAPFHHHHPTPPRSPLLAPASAQMPSSLLTSEHPNLPASTGHVLMQKPPLTLTPSAACHTPSKAMLMGTAAEVSVQAGSSAHQQHSSSDRSLKPSWQQAAVATAVTQRSAHPHALQTQSLEEGMSPSFRKRYPCSPSQEENLQSFAMMSPPHLRASYSHPARTLLSACQQHSAAEGLVQVPTGPQNIQMSPQMVLQDCTKALTCNTNNTTGTVLSNGHGQHILQVDGGASRCREAFLALDHLYMQPCTAHVSTQPVCRGSHSKSMLVSQGTECLIKDSAAKRSASQELPRREPSSHAKHHPHVSCVHPPLPNNTLALPPPTQLPSSSQALQYNLARLGVDSSACLVHFQEACFQNVRLHHNAACMDRHFLSSTTGQHTTRVSADLANGPQTAACQWRFGDQQAVLEGSQVPPGKWPLCCNVARPSHPSTQSEPRPEVQAQDMLCRVSGGGADKDMQDMCAALTTSCFPSTAAMDHIAASSGRDCAGELRLQKPMQGTAAPCQSTITPNIAPKMSKESHKINLRVPEIGNSHAMPPLAPQWHIDSMATASHLPMAKLSGTPHKEGSWTWGIHTLDTEHPESHEQKLEAPHHLPEGVQGPGVPFRRVVRNHCGRSSSAFLQPARPCPEEALVDRADFISPIQSRTWLCNPQPQPSGTYDNMPCLSSLALLKHAQPHCRLEVTTPTVSPCHNFASSHSPSQVPSQTACLETTSLQGPTRAPENHVHAVPMSGTASQHRPQDPTTTVDQATSVYKLAAATADEEHRLSYAFPAVPSHELVRTTASSRVPSWPTLAMPRATSCPGHMYTYHSDSADACADAWPECLEQMHELPFHLAQQHPEESMAAAAQNRDPARHSDPLVINATGGNRSPAMAQSKNSCLHAWVAVENNSMKQGIASGGCMLNPHQRTDVNPLNASNQYELRTPGTLKHPSPCEKSASMLSCKEWGKGCRRASLSDRGVDQIKSQVNYEQKNATNGILVKVPVRRAKYVPSLRIERHFM
jgi:hypothetical protein